MTTDSGTSSQPNDVPFPDEGTANRRRSSGLMEKWLPRGSSFRRSSMDSIVTSMSEWSSTVASATTPFEMALGSLARRKSLVQIDTGRGRMCSKAHGRWENVRHTCQHASREPKILLAVFLTFAVLCAGGLSAVIISGKNDRDSEMYEVMDGASEMKYRIDDELFFAKLPLFTMEEMARQIDIFEDLPMRITNAQAVTDRKDDRPFVDVGGICDDPKYLTEYEHIASSIKANSANMKGVLINIQLEPAAVVCLVHPRNNTEDFENGAYFQSERAVGLDLMRDANSAYYARMAIDQKRETLQGPIDLIEGVDQEGSRVLAARNPIYVHHKDDIGKNGTQIFWGFATVLLNWAELEKQLDLHGFFKDKAMQFKLIGTVAQLDLDTDQVTEKTIVIAESENSGSLTAENSESLALEAFDSGWVLVMGYPESTLPHYVIWGSILVIFVSLIFSLGLMVILVAKSKHEALLYRMMPRKVIHRLQRGETVIEKYDHATLCFFDIVSFTTISGQMEAHEVMNMLKILYTEFDKIAEKHQVFNVETIGDAYIVIGGGPDGCDGVEGARKVASFALDCIEATRNLRFDDSWQVSIRSGLASGVVVAGVVGTDLVPKFTLFGDTVTLGDYLESSSDVMRTLCSQETCHLLKQSPTHDFDLSQRTDGKKLFCNNTPIQQTFWVNGVTDKVQKSYTKDQVQPADVVLLDIQDNVSEASSAITDASSPENAPNHNLLVEEAAESENPTNSEGSTDLPRNSSVNDLLHMAYETHTKQNDTENSNNIDYTAKELPHEENKSETNNTENTETNSKVSFSSEEFSRTHKHKPSKFDDDDCSIKSSGFQDYWSSLAETNEAWQDQNDKEEEKRRTVVETCCSYMSMMWRSTRRLCYIAVTNKKILLLSFIVFAAICSAGLAIVLLFARDYERNQQELAVQKAEDADRWLSVELQKSLLPLFAMSELVRDLGFLFDDLPYLIESRPLNEAGTFRNVTGICDDPDILKPFNEMAASIKESSEMKKILVNIQLAPFGVLCLTHPLNNTEDFENGAYLDTSKAIGVDLLNHPSRSSVSRAAVKEDRYTIQGPIPLVQGAASVVDEAIIARYPVRDTGHNITIEGEEYSFWGFSIALMDWDKLQKMFGLHDFFLKSGMEFKMTRTDTMTDAVTNEQYTEVVVIAESERSDVLQEDNTVSVPLQSTDNGWELTVGLEAGFSPPWKIWGCIVVVVGSFLLSTLLLMVLVTTKEHELLLYRMMPQDAIRRLQRGETVVDRDACATVFFSKILGFSTLSGQMKPTEFMIMLNQVYEEFDKLTVKHAVSKVESIGAAYIVTAPGPEKCIRTDGVVRVALFALDAMDFVRNYRYKDMRIFIRSGLASGPVVSGVIGAALPKYTIFGDTVNFASRMESTSKSMKVQCSEKTHQLLRDSPEFEFETEKREVLVKGKGLKCTWWIYSAQVKGNGDTVKPNESAVADVEENTSKGRPNSPSTLGRHGKRVSFSGKEHDVIKIQEPVEDTDPSTEGATPQ